MIEIKHKTTGEVLHTVDADSLSGAYLIGATLSGADFRYADLSGAYLSGAKLRDAYLSGAKLRDADFRYADLSVAYLSGADLSYADLSGADLRDADLRDATLSGADFRDANLSYANLSGAKDAPIVIYGLRWYVYINSEYIHIGCEKHTLDEWEAFSDEQISRMDSNALAFWKTHKDMILAAGRCARGKATKED